MAIHITRLDGCIRDVAAAAQIAGPEPYHYQGYQKLIEDLERSVDTIPVKYQSAVGIPFCRFLYQMGSVRIESIMAQGKDSYPRNMIEDVINALIFQSVHAHDKSSTDAFEEVVSDLYDGFLSGEDRTKSGFAIRPPDQGVLPPLVTWGNPTAGPYTWPVDAVSRMGLSAPIVSLPQGYARQGLVSWTSLAHETGGHDVLRADTGLLDEICSKVYYVVGSRYGEGLAKVWRNWTEETASDVQGLLNMGPTAGIGLIGFFRGLIGGPLRTSGGFTDPHPVDILRGHVAAEIVSKMNPVFSGANEWRRLIEEQTFNDWGQESVVHLYDARQSYTILQEKAISSATLVADTIFDTKWRSLEGHSLSEIQTWSDSDQRIADSLRRSLKMNRALPAGYRGNGYYAAHAVAAATAEAMDGSSQVTIPQIFERMKEYLVVMHRDNLTWQQNVVGLRRPAFSIFEAPSEEARSSGPIVL